MTESQDSRLQIRLVQLWRDSSPWIYQTLHQLHAVPRLTVPLGRYPRSCLLLIRESFPSTDFHQRQLAANLAGFIDRPFEVPSPPGAEILKQMLIEEIARDASYEPTDLERLCCQAVVEEIVHAAIRWMRRRDARPVALDVLEVLMENALLDGSRHWSVAGEALIALHYYEVGAFRNWLDRYEAWSRLAPNPIHPAERFPEAERQLIADLRSANTMVLQGVETKLVDAEAFADTVTLHPDTQDAIAQLVDAARAAEAAE